MAGCTLILKELPESTHCPSCSANIAIPLASKNQRMGIRDLVCSCGQKITLVFLGVK